MMPMLLMLMLMVVMMVVGEKERRRDKRINCAKAIGGKDHHSEQYWQNARSGG
jgi:hypothetical protein